MLHIRSACCVCFVSLSLSRSGCPFWPLFLLPAATLGLINDGFSSIAAAAVAVFFAPDCLRFYCAMCNDNLQLELLPLPLLWPPMYVNGATVLNDK